MAEEASGLDRSIEAEVILTLIAWAHIPSSLLHIPSERELNETSLYLSDIRARVVPGTDDIFRLNIPNRATISAGL